jgi:hypothetical protein
LLLRLIERPFFYNLGFTSLASMILGIGIVALAASTLSIFASRALEKSSTFFGNLIKGQIASTEEKILKNLMSESWILNFNPKSPNGKKQISFRADGSIGKGKNKNESSWRIRNGLLEILDSEGRVHSRFLYAPDSGSFAHTNDLDTLSIKSQEITRDIKA